MGPLPEDVSLKIGASSLRLSRDLQGDPNLDLLADPDRFFSFPQCEIIKDQKKIKVARMPLEIGGRIQGVYLKRYNVFSWRYRVGSLFVPTPASRSWAGAGILLRAGFSTGRPIAAVECRSWGMITKSFYLSEEIPGGRTVDAYWREALRAVSGREGLRRRLDFLRRLANLFRSLHESHIYHNDLKDANILVPTLGAGREESFYLLDLEGIRRCGRLSRRRRIKNLMQLHRTMGKFLRATEKLHWLKAYLGPAFFDRGEKRRWIKKVLEESSRGDLRSLGKK